MPDVGAGALAAADALPAPEPARAEAMGGRGREDGGVGERAVQEPVRQRRVVPGIVPELGVPAEARVFFARHSPPRRRRRRSAWRSSCRSRHRRRPGSLLGKCQATTKVTVCDLPGASVTDFGDAADQASRRPAAGVCRAQGRRRGLPASTAALPTPAEQRQRHRAAVAVPLARRRRRAAGGRSGRSASTPTLPQPPVPWS